MGGPGFVLPTQSRQAAAAENIRTSEVRSTHKCKIQNNNHNKGKKAKNKDKNKGTESLKLTLRLHPGNARPVSKEV